MTKWTCDIRGGSYAVVPVGGPRHDARSPRCWCGPESICSQCDGRQVAPCIHGSERVEIITHRESN